jgi:hypothetical protein
VLFYFSFARPDALTPYARKALHCLVGAKLLNTLSGSAACTVVFSLISADICFFVSLPRPLSQLSGLGTFSAATMGIAVLLAIVFSGIQDHPAGYVAGEAPIVTKWPVPGTGFVGGSVPRVQRGTGRLTRPLQACPRF